MGFRTIVVKNRCKLEYSLNFLIVRNQEGEQRIHIGEIESLIIQSTQVSITSALLSNLAENNINVIICDTKANPSAELIQFNGIYDSRDKLVNQFNIGNEIKDLCWQSIITQKIANQYKVHKRYSTHEEINKLIEDYLNNIQIGDTTNREGHTAKIYFNSLFGKEFSRDLDCDVNTYLNYGYTIILSCFNRALRSIGYYPELGIHHIGKTNPFNLSCDLMEPIRPLIDSMVLSGKLNQDNFKRELTNVLNEQVEYDGNKMYLENAIKLYCKSVMSCMISKKVNDIKFIKYDI